MAVKKIHEREELVALAKKLGVRQDWHEPDNQDVSIEVRGASFDNAGFWGKEFEDEKAAKPKELPCEPEMYVIISHRSKPVAEVNLADLFAFASCAEIPVENKRIR